MSSRSHPDAPVIEIVYTLLCDSSLCAGPHGGLWHVEKDLVGLFRVLALFHRCK